MKKIIIAYPSFQNIKGIPLLSQNRQYQVFTEKTVIYPVVPAQAATLLKQAGYEVIWLDCLAEGLSYERFIEIIRQEEPDLVAFETKTPVVKQHWKIIDELKRLASGNWQLATVLFGDHVTALPEESFQNCQVDFVLCGGDYDFLLLNLCNYLDHRLSAIDHRPIVLESGIYYRDNGSVKNTGPFKLNHDLNSLPFINRDLTKWHLYAYKNGNYKRTPGTYLMSGRDCWWGKCTFCFEPSMRIFTNRGNETIKDIVEGYDDSFKDILVMTHKGRFQPVTKTFKRYYKGDILSIELFSLKQHLELTPNHKILALRRATMKRCSKRNAWSYFCVPGRISKRLSCEHCLKQYYTKYMIDFVESGQLKKTDFVAIPIMREVRDKRRINVQHYLENKAIFVPTTKLKSDSLIDEIVIQKNLGHSQRAIARQLKINRSTVKRYIELYEANQLKQCEKAIIEEGGFIKYEYGKKWIPRYIPLSYNFLRLVGYYLAEGHVTVHKKRPNSYCLCLTFSAKESEYINDVVTIASNLFKKIDVRQHLNRKNHTIQISINSTILAIFFKRLFGSNSYDKRIPDDFLYLPVDKQKELLRGLFRGDGHLRIRHREGGSEYILETVSSILAQQVVTIIFRNEAIPRFRIYRPSNDKEALRHSISLSQYDIGIVFPEIKVPLRSTKYRHGFVLKDLAFVPIKSILRKKYAGMVYNLQVADDHSYTANNVAVSNCSWPTLYPYFRVRKAENVLDEVGRLIENYQVREIMDDTGTFPVGDWLRDFCDGMIKREYNKKIYLDCNMRFGALSYEDFCLMKKANFRLLLFGLESANQKTLDRLNKDVKVESIIEGCRLAAKAGLFPHITIMFGYPWEAYEDALKTLNLGKWLLKKGYAYTMQATVVIPYPGTPLFVECKQNGWLKTLNWDDYDMKQPVMQTSIPDCNLLQLVQGMYKISFNPEFVLRKVFSLRDIDDVAYSLRAAKKVMGHIFDFKKREVI